MVSGTQQATKSISLNTKMTRWEIYAYRGQEDLDYLFALGPDNQYLNYYAVFRDHDDWAKMQDEVKTKRENEEKPDGTFTVTKFITGPKENQEGMEGE